MKSGEKISGSVAVRSTNLQNVSKSAGKAMAEEDNTSDSDGPPEELACLDSDLKNPNWKKIEHLRPPTPSRMYNWTVADYESYDEFLIAKWKAVGFSENETVYMSTRDQNSRLAQTYRYIWSKRKGKGKF